MLGFPWWPVTFHEPMFQEMIDQLKSEVDAILYRVLEVENMTEAVRADLSPEIAVLEDGVERCVLFPSGCGGGVRVECQRCTTYQLLIEKRISLTVQRIPFVRCS